MMVSQAGTLQVWRYCRRFCCCGRSPSTPAHKDKDKGEGEQEGTGGTGTAARADEEQGLTGAARLHPTLHIKHYIIRTLCI